MDYEIRPPFEEPDFKRLFLEVEKTHYLHAKWSMLLNGVDRDDPLIQLLFAVVSTADKYNAAQGLKIDFLKSSIEDLNEKMAGQIEQGIKRIENLENDNEKLLRLCQTLQGNNVDLLESNQSILALIQSKYKNKNYQMMKESFDEMVRIVEESRQESVKKSEWMFKVALAGLFLTIIISSFT